MHHLFFIQDRKLIIIEAKKLPPLINVFYHINNLTYSKSILKDFSYKKDNYQLTFEKK